MNDSFTRAKNHLREVLENSVIQVPRHILDQRGVWWWLGNSCLVVLALLLAWAWERQEFDSVLHQYVALCVIVVMLATLPLSGLLVMLLMRSATRKDPSPRPEVIVILNQRLIRAQILLSQD